MSDNLSNEPQELSFTDRALWEKGLYIPRTLNVKVMDSLKAVAIKLGYPGTGELERISVLFPIRSVGPDNNRAPVYHMVLDNLTLPIPTLIDELGEYADKKFPGKINFDPRRSSVHVDVSCKELRPLIDVLLKGFIEKHAPEYAVDFPATMEAAAPTKGVNYAPGSKNWRTSEELALAGKSSNDEYYGISGQGLSK